MVLEPALPMPTAVPMVLLLRADPLLMNTVNCDSCDTGYRPVGSVGSRTCAANAYTCPNGTAATGRPTTHNTVSCTGCDTGYRRVGSSCAANAYSCPNGTAATGRPTTHNTVSCTGCDTGYRRVGSSCAANAYSCPNGTAATGRPATHNTVNCSSCNTDYRKTSGTRPSCENFVVIWDAGFFKGNFGFSRCQNQLNANETLGNTLRGDGFTKAVFFGSTDSYHFVDIDTDEHALGIQTGTYTFTTKAEALPVSVVRVSGSTVTYTPSTDSDTISSNTVTRLDHLVNVPDSGVWQNNGGNVIHYALNGNHNFWTFTGGKNYTSLYSCGDAGSNLFLTRGTHGNTTAVDAKTSDSSAPGIGYSTIPCSGNRKFLCIAR